MKSIQQSDRRIVDILLDFCKGVRLAKKGRKIIRSVKKNKKEYEILATAVLSLPKRCKRR